MLMQPYQSDELTFAWCYRVYYRWRTHRRKPNSNLSKLTAETLSDLLQPYGIHLLELAADTIDIRALVSGVFGQASAKAVSDRWLQLQNNLRLRFEKVSFVPDHVHVAVMLHPAVDPAAVVVALMNAGQEVLWSQFDRDVIQAGAQRLWQPSAYVGSFGDLTSNAISAYVARWERDSEKSFSE